MHCFLTCENRTFLSRTGHTRFTSRALPRAAIGVDTTARSMPRKSYFRHRSARHSIDIILILIFLHQVFKLAAGMDHFFQLPAEQWSKLHYDFRSPASIVEDAVQMLSHHGHIAFVESDKAIQCELISKFVFDSNQFECVGDSWLATKECIACTACANGPIDDVKEVNMMVEAFLQTQPVDAAHQIKRRQIVQHLAAYAHMCHSSLDALWSSVDGIKDLHRVLTTGLEDADPDASVQPGCFRSSARHGIGIGQRVVVYMDHRDIDVAMVEFAETMKRHLQISCQLGPNPRMFLLIAHIFYKFLLIHPFGDGNGRMSRLLANHVLVLHGIRLPVSFVAGKHKRAKAHYSQVLDRAQHKDGNPSRLATFAAEMLSQSMSAFIAKGALHL
jgi:hypothetical protein